MTQVKDNFWRKVAANVVAIGCTIFLLFLLIHFAMVWGTRASSRRSVPEFAGLSLAEAQKVAKENDLKLEINDSLYVPIYKGGTVLDQLPNEGVEVKPDRTIYITINAFTDKMVRVPYVAGYSLRQAKNILEMSGLEIGTISYSSDIATNYVLSQSYNGVNILPTSKVDAKMGAGVNLKVGVKRSDDPYSAAPELVGLTLKQAKSRIWESGMNVGRINFDKDINLLDQRNAVVYKQSRPASQSVQWGSKMDIWLKLNNNNKE